MTTIYPDIQNTLGKLYIINQYVPRLTITSFSILFFSAFGLKPGIYGYFWVFNWPPLKGCVRYIFACLFFKSKREPLSN